LAAQVPFPKDGENLISKIDQVEKEEDTRLAEFIKEIAKSIEVLKAEVGWFLLFKKKANI
jgi:hypothetical protein